MSPALRMPISGEDHVQHSAVRPARDRERGLIAAVRRISRLNVAAIILIAVGVVVAFYGHDTLRWSPPPLPPAWAARSSEITAMPRGGKVKDEALGRSVPVSIDIPSIHVDAKVIKVGLNANGTVAVPPLSTPMVTGWYDKGPAPGQPGAAAILGHVDAAKVGPAVFYQLGNLRPGAKIFVRLRSGRVAIFEAYSIALFAKAKFPTQRVFGYSSWPTLRLITCGGLFDQKTGHYLGNIVAFASYIGSRR